MIDRLELTKNVQFYISKKDDNNYYQTTDDMIKEIVSASEENMESESQFLINVFRKKSETTNGKEYKYTIVSFATLRPVYFINNENIEDIPSDEFIIYHDRIYAFILLFEFSEYLIILKKSCANITDQVDKYFDLIGTNILTGTFNDEDVDFQKMSFRNMTISDKALRNRSYEAADLKGLLSTHAAGRSIPYFLKLRHGSTIKTISGTGRLVETSQRKSLNEVADWIYEQIQLIQEEPKSNAFLSSFAKKIDLNEILKFTSPAAILFESTAIYEKIKSDGIILKYSAKDGTDKVLSEKMLNKLFCEMEKVYDINENWEVSCRYDSMKIRRNTKSMTITSIALKRIKLYIDEKDITLQKFIVKNGFYSITFTNPNYLYFMGNCFEDVSGISEVDNLLKMLEPQLNMERISSEKGSFSSSSTVMYSMC